MQKAVFIKKKLSMCFQYKIHLVQGSIRNTYVWVTQLLLNKKLNISSKRVNHTRKNNNIHKTKFKKSDDQKNIDKYRVATNITEYQIISKLIFLRIIISKFMRIRQELHVKSKWKKINMFKMDVWFLVTIIELLHTLHCTWMYYESSFRILNW